MDDQASKRWLESMRRERRAKEAWQAKYLTAEEQQRSKEEQDALGAIEEAKPPKGKRLTERDVMMQRLSKYADDGSAGEPVPVPAYQLQRERIRKEVAASRPRAHRLTRDLTTGAMLRDMGPGMWISINPGVRLEWAHPSPRSPVPKRGLASRLAGYVHATPKFFTSSTHITHEFDPKKGWTDPPDKTHHMKQDDFMAHADKCLELGEKPFVGGGMKLKPAAA